jgi:hypothetical protein
MPRSAPSRRAPQRRRTSLAGWSTRLRTENKRACCVLHQQTHMQRSASAWTCSGGPQTSAGAPRAYLLCPKQALAALAPVCNSSATSLLATLSNLMICRFVGLLLVTRLLPAGDASTIRAVHDAVGGRFMLRLLLPLKAAEVRTRRRATACLQAESVYTQCCKQRCVQRSPCRGGHAARRRAFARKQMKTLQPRTWGAPRSHWPSWPPSAACRSWRARRRWWSRSPSWSRRAPTGRALPACGGLH